MAARRDGIDGEKNPPGILTHLKGTAVGRIIEEIEKRSEPGAIGIGLELLKLSGETANDLSRIIDKIATDVAKDGKPHNATMSIGQGDSGITVHCNSLPDRLAGPKLEHHCELRKYSAKARTWFGLAIRPADGAVRFGLMLDYPWKQDAAKDAVAAKMSPLNPVGRKIGRNDPQRSQIQEVPSAEGWSPLRSRWTRLRLERRVRTNHAGADARLPLQVRQDQTQLPNGGAGRLGAQMPAISRAISAIRAVMALCCSSGSGGIWVTIVG